MEAVNMRREDVEADLQFVLAGAGDSEFLESVLAKALAPAYEAQGNSSTAGTFSLQEEFLHASRDQLEAAMREAGGKEANGGGVEEAQRFLRTHQWLQMSLEGLEDAQLKLADMASEGGV